jgi:hypothetical protein
MPEFYEVVHAKVRGDAETFLGLTRNSRLRGRDHTRT